MNIVLTEIVVLSFVLLLCLAEQTAGQNDSGDRADLILRIVNNHAASRIQETDIPRVRPDGKFYEMCSVKIWENAVTWRLPWEVNREENRAANEETYILMATDEKSIHVMFVSFDSNTSGIRATLTDRGAWEWNNNDAVGLMLDTYNDGRNAYVIAVNAAGVQFDAMRLDRGALGTEDDESYNFLWDSNVTYFEGGYITEITIPFNQLQIRSEREIIEMGFYPFRLQPRDFIYWYSGVTWDFDRNCYICQFPKIKIHRPEIDGSGGLIQVLPYLSGLSEGGGEGLNLTGHSTDHTISAGVDLKYQRTNSVIDATIWPDFSQVETDAFQMTSNVRFMPLLPERRPFFMERADLFRLPIEETIYTRSIVDPLAGGRWTGKTDRHNWAVITMPDQTGWLIDPGPQESRLAADDSVDSWTNIFRYRFDMSQDLMMGALYSDRITEGGYNRLLSHDGQFSVSSNHTLQTQILGSWNRYPEFFTDSYGVTADETFDYGYLISFRRTGSQYGGVGHDYILETRRLGENLVTGTGVLQRTGIQQTDVNFGYNFWLDHRYVERIRPYIRSTIDWRLENGRILSGRNHIGLHIFAINRSYLFPRIRYEREHVRRIVNGVPLEGDFDLFSGRIRMETSITPDYFSSLNIGFGEAVDFNLVEKMNQFQFTLDNELFLLGRQMEISHSVEYMQLFHAEPAQEAVTQRLRMDYQITRRSAIRNIVQYRDFRFHDPRYPEHVPDRVKTVQSQLMLRYRLNYATALHLGGFVEFGEDLSRFVQISAQEESQWQVFLKLSYLL